jgi:hypothetical protein
MLFLTQQKAVLKILYSGFNGFNGTHIKAYYDLVLHLRESQTDKQIRKAKIKVQSGLKAMDIRHN